MSRRRIIPGRYKWDPEDQRCTSCRVDMRLRDGRELTMAQLAFERDVAFPFEMPRLAEYRGQLEQFVTRGPEQARGRAQPGRGTETP